tara:strand:- start:371 stop:574 length:204 start_codon:yes stop_codon:yes gene_type:complete
MKKKIDKKKIISVINQIQKIRSRNNVNWMDILRLAVDKAPTETVKLMSKINNQDRQISKLFRQISKK